MQSTISSTTAPSAQDRWEENAGISPFALGIEIAALVGAADFFDDRDERTYCLSLADYWNERIEDWTYVDQGLLAQPHGVEGYYVRIGPPPTQCGPRSRVDLRNRSGERIAAAAMVEPRSMPLWQRAAWPQLDRWTLPETFLMSSFLLRRRHSDAVEDQGLCSCSFNLQMRRHHLSRIHLFSGRAPPLVTVLSRPESPLVSPPGR